VGSGVVPLLGQPCIPETNGPNFGDGVQEDAENVQAELAAATDVLTNMPFVSDDN
jgi:hypothetical protein